MAKGAIELLLPLATYQKIMGYVEACPIEITGFADITYNSELNALIAGEVYLPDQEAGGADVELSDEDLENFMNLLMAQGITQTPRLWWHSHVNMGVTFSGTDVETMGELAQIDWGVALVLNKAGKMTCNINLGKPFPQRIQSVEVKILYPEFVNTAELEAEVDLKVRRRVITPTTFNGNHGKTEHFDWEAWNKKKRKKNNKDHAQAVKEISAILDREVSQVVDMVDAPVMFGDHNVSECLIVQCQLCQNYQDYLDYYEMVYGDYERGRIGE